MTALYPEKNATPLAQGTADAALTPIIRTITFADLHDALRLGWDDFKAVPSHPVILCLYVIYPALSLGLAGMLLGYSVLPLLFPLVAGFVLIGPFAALGLYELSRRRELGEATSVWHATQVLRSSSFGAMLGLGMLLLTVFVVWVATAQMIYVSTFGTAPFVGIPNFVTRVLTTPEGWGLIVVGCGVGFLFAVVVLCIGVVSFPLMHDRHASAADAITTSFRAVAQNPIPMAAWGLIVAVLLLLGTMPLFLGRAVVIPLLGHSTWHLYRKVVERGPNLREMSPVAQASFAGNATFSPEKRRVRRIVERLRSGLWSWLPLTLSNGLTTVGLSAMILGTSPTVGESGHRFLFGTVIVVWGLIATEFIFGFWTAPATSGRRAYLASAECLIDLAAAFALPLGWLLTPTPSDAPLFTLIWALRYIRHTSGLGLFWRVMQRSRTPLLSIASLFVVIFLTAATLAYVFERNAQPEAFGSVPRAMWWAIATLTTTGYGDLMPTTVWGRLLAGWVMVGGIVIFALQAGIIATAFAEELRRRHFLHTWDLVTAVPFFRGLGAAAIADVVRLLSAREVAEGTIVVSVGEPGDAMYFIVSGEVTVHLTSRFLKLGPGQFFGEMALVFGAPRSATVTATKPSVLLVLDIADFRELAGRRPELVNLIEIEGKRRREANAATARF